MRNALLLFLILALIVGSSFSQLKYTNHVLGGTVGFSSKYSPVIYGINYEYQLPQAGVGIFAVGAIGRHWSFTEKLKDNRGQFDYSNNAVGGQVNYNFNSIGRGTFIPFVGIVVGYNNVSTKYTSYNGVDLTAVEQTYKSGLFMWGQGGMRYFVSEKFAGAVRLGLGNFDLSTVEFGLDYRF